MDSIIKWRKRIKKLLVIRIIYLNDLMVSFVYISLIDS